MFPCRRLPIVFAAFLMAQGAAAQDSADTINPAEQLMADILIAVAEIELDLKARGAEGIEPPKEGGDLLGTTQDRVAALDDVDLPEVAVVVPPDGPKDVPEDDTKDDAKVDPAESVPPVVDPPEVATVVETIPDDGTGVTPVSLNGTSIHSALFQDLSADEIAKLPQVDPARCSELGEWFLALSLQRDFLAFFVAEKESVRICRRLGTSWFVKRASNGNRAHLVAVID
ncbi:hypothetical protein [Antarctobacter heliothermus]|uniref:Uncharacterized protein n=1 Tax=Antarctobacter heliothermus TaxID=74033 RepID=A0A239EYG8_9RHOB|nr:hypothetical protein [Antarctobacter heliothermus]SNS49083.1 hypothetical protein SAMN04488078_101730 [Antarctobacter heliothermus]